MAIQNGGQTFAFKAATDMSTYQFKVVKLSTTTAFTVETMSAAGDAPYGILQNTPSATQEAFVRVIAGGGFTKISADEVVTIGAPLMVSADGQAVSGIRLALTGTSYFIGDALEASTSADDFITISLGGHWFRGGV
jgi:hypothetical protein